MFNVFVKYVGRNFGNPNGIGGIVSTKIMNVINQKQYAAVLQNLNMQPNETILDIGFGNGYVINKLFKQKTPLNIYGIEISEDMLNKVTKKYSKKLNKMVVKNKKDTTAIFETMSQKKHVKLFLENIHKTSFAGNIFDKIYTVNTLYFWNELSSCFAEIMRILKPNGIFLNVIYSKEYLEKLIFTKYVFQKLTIEEIKKITESNGMKVLKTIEIQKNKSYCIVSKNVHNDKIDKN
jgi:ubiquinone/menaquinone biosynthesis C-methylase UbiE